MDHDVNFAPNVDYGICTLCGCKRTTIETWAERGSWVIGIGGNGTGKPNKVIYAMEVEGNLPYYQFRKRFPRKGKYLQERAHPTANVLFSRKFYYFGDRAVNLPHELQHMIIRGPGCKCVSDEDVTKLNNHLVAEGHSYGKRGNPNNGDYRGQQQKCRNVPQEQGNCHQ
jgi:hypothetical protein